MRRTKEWWARLEPWERQALVRLERDNNRLGSGSAYLPEDCTECPSCGNPTVGVGMCQSCSSVLEKLLAKANRKVPA